MNSKNINIKEKLIADIELLTYTTEDVKKVY